MGIDIAGVLFSVNPGGRIAPLLQVRTLLCDTSGTRPAMLARDGLEVGRARLFTPAGGSFLPWLGAALRRCGLADTSVDVGVSLLLEMAMVANVCLKLLG